MLEHLINGEFHPEVVDATAEVLSFEKADPTMTIDAKVKTAQWLKDLELDDEEVETKADAEAEIGRAHLNSSHEFVSRMPSSA